MLESLFKLKQNNTDVKTEVIAGITTFMTMAYIIFVNPGILKAAGIPFEATIITTCLAAAIMTIAMGLFTNYPFALASGMGLNAFLAYGIVLGMKVPWQTAMGMVFIEGIIITVLAMTNFREAIMNAIPLTQKRAIGVGIGLFIAFIGLKDAGFITSNPETFVQLGKFTSPGVIVAAIGLLVTAFLMARRIKGAILLGIVITTIVGFFFHDEKGMAITSLAGLSHGIFTDFSKGLVTIGKLNIIGALKWGFASTIFALIISDFFDTMGTVVSIGGKADYLDKEGRLPRLKSVLLVDGLAAAVGGLLSASSVTAYVESASGVAEGGRTGLTAVVVGVLFVLALFFAPIIGVVPSAAVAPALIIVGYLMMTIVKEIDFGSFDEGFPAFLTLISIPLTFSIANGIGFGFVTYTVIKLFTGKHKDIHPLMYLVAVIFILNFIVRA